MVLRLVIQINDKHPDDKSLKGFGGAGVLEVVEDFDRGSKDKTERQNRKIEKTKQRQNKDKTDRHSVKTGTLSELHRDKTDRHSV